MTEALLSASSQSRLTSQERDIRLYMFFRLVLLYSVVISLVAQQQSGILAQDTTVKTYFVTFFTFLVTTGFVFLYEKAKSVRYFLVSQIAYDILFTTVLIFYTGPFESMYTVFYLFNIVFASIMFPRMGAIGAAVASSVLYMAIAWINSEPGHDERAYSLLTTVTAFISLSLLSSQLVEELRRSRQRISRLEELSEEIVNSLDSGLLGLDAQGLIRKINRTAQVMLDIDAPEKLIGRKAADVLPTLGEVGESEVRELGIRGQVRRMLLTRVQLPESHSMLLLRDLTDVLDLEEKVRRQERLASVGRLAAGVAHEVRNPIASISGAAQLLSANADDGEERDRLTALIIRESERVDRLVNSLLRFSRPPQGAKEQVCLETVLLECIESIKTRPEFASLGVEVSSDVKGPLTIHGNRDELSEVVTNLLVNAMQALMDDKSEKVRRIKVSASMDRGQARIVVSDNGPGIPSEFRSRIFDPFFTTKPTGTGLGLAQVHKIVRDHNGQVDLDTEEGRGTSLTIRLPA